MKLLFFSSLLAALAIVFWPEPKDVVSPFALPDPITVSELPTNTETEVAENHLTSWP
jgi:hypothetical protein